MSDGGGVGATLNQVSSGELKSAHDPKLRLNLLSAYMGMHND